MHVILPRCPILALILLVAFFYTSYVDIIECWDETVLPVLESMPLIATEIGENDCTSDYINQLMPWLDSMVCVFSLALNFNLLNCPKGVQLPSVDLECLELL